MDQSENLGQGKHEKYKKIKVLGEGSMGKVYLVECSENQELCVMKRIYIGHLEQAEKEKAKKEAQLHSILKHKNIVAFKEVYHTTGDKLCIIMEYADGGNLDEFITNQGGKHLTEESLLKMFGQICLGIREVHQNKIAHRDLKGANIFMTSNGTIKIGDFGISKSLDKTVMASKSFVGTPYYLSPEMVEGKPYSTKSDIWSLGVILYHMCTFKLPFDANSLPVLALKILKGSFPPIVVGNYSRDLKSLILSMLQVDTKKRPNIEQILCKPFLLKHLDKQDRQKIAATMSKPKPQKNVESKNQLKNNKSITDIKIQKIKLLEKGKSKDVTEDDKLKKDEQKEKREDLRQKMRDDLKKKRKEIEKDKPEQKGLKQSPTSKVEKKAKIEQEQYDSRKQIKTEKPWKTKKVATGQKKQIAVQLFVPQVKKQKQILKEYQSVPDFKIQIFEGKKPPNFNTMKEDLGQIIQSQNILSERKSMPNFPEVENYHFSNKNIDQNSQEQEIVEEQIEESMDLEQMLKKVKNIGEMANNLSNPYPDIDLYEESADFDNTIEINTKKQKIKEEEVEKMNSVINSSENLEQLRFILEQKIGDDKFMKAHQVIKDHFETYYKMVVQEKNDKEKIREEYVYNKELLRKKLNFLEPKEFDDNIELLYTVIIYQQMQMQQNSQNFSKYQSLL